MHHSSSAPHLRMKHSIVKLPAIPAKHRQLEEPKDIFEAFKSREERAKVATIKYEQMLDDKYIHSSMRELKFKADQQRLPLAFPDSETGRLSKSHAFSGLQELSQQLQASQRKVMKDNKASMLQFLEVSKQKSGSDQTKDILHSILGETQPLVKATKKDWIKHQVELFKDGGDIRSFKKHFHQLPDTVSEQ
jgi:hypothetical protein